MADEQPPPPPPRPVCPVADGEAMRALRGLQEEWTANTAALPDDLRQGPFKGVPVRAVCAWLRENTDDYQGKRIKEMRPAVLAALNHGRVKGDVVQIRGRYKPRAPQPRR